MTPLHIRDDLLADAGGDRDLALIIACSLLWAIVPATSAGMLGRRFSLDSLSGFMRNDIRVTEHEAAACPKNLPESPVPPRYC